MLGLVTFLEGFTFSDTGAGSLVRRSGAELLGDGDVFGEGDRDMAVGGAR